MAAWSALTDLPGRDVLGGWTKKGSPYHCRTRTCRFQAAGYKVWTNGRVTCGPLHKRSEILTTAQHGHSLVFSLAIGGIVFPEASKCPKTTSQVVGIFPLSPSLPPDLYPHHPVESVAPRRALTKQHGVPPFQLQCLGRQHCACYVGLCSVFSYAEEGCKRAVIYAFEHTANWPFDRHLDHRSPAL